MGAEPTANGRRIRVSCLLQANLPNSNNKDTNAEAPPVPSSSEVKQKKLPKVRDHKWMFASSLPEADLEHFIYRFQLSHRRWVGLFMCNTTSHLARFLSRKARSMQQETSHETNEFLTTYLNESLNAACQLTVYERQAVCLSISRSSDIRAGPRMATSMTTLRPSRIEDCDLRSSVFEAQISRDDECGLAIRLERRNLLDAAIASMAELTTLTARMYSAANCELPDWSTYSAWRAR